jgi:hypothetical protein
MGSQFVDHTAMASKASSTDPGHMSEGERMP